MSEVCIVGGGLAGLSCAGVLQANGIPFRLLEAADGLGGRVRTDKQEGYLLDRGFQIVQTAYPELERQLDSRRLRLHRFMPGALVRFKGKFQRFVDPTRSPREIFSLLRSPLGSRRDKMHMPVLKRKVTQGSLSELFDRKETTTLEYLQNEGFSSQFIDHFFRPFFSGVFFESKLDTTSRMFEFVFRILSQGDGALPEEGIGALSQQLARGVSEEFVSLNTRVESVDKEGVRLDSGERISCRAVVLATDAQQASRFLGDSIEVPYVSSLCLSYAADKAPIREPILVLNGEAEGPITNLCVPSQVASSYAPKGKSQVMVTVVEQSEKGSSVEPEVRDQLREWFGREVDYWRLLRAWPMEKALPDLKPPTNHPERQQVRRGKGLYVCGEYGSLSSFQWAMHSGRKAGEAVVEDLIG